MGYASLFEDLFDRIEELKTVIEDHNRTDSKKIDVHAVFEFRKEIVLLLEKIKSHAESDYPELLEKLSEAEHRIMDLEEKNFKQEKELLKNTKEVERLYEVNQQLMDKNKDQKARLSDCKKSRKEEKQSREEFERIAAKRQEEIFEHKSKQMQREFGDQLMELDGLFREVFEMTKSSGWTQNKDNLNRIKQIARTGIETSL